MDNSTDLNSTTTSINITRNNSVSIGTYMALCLSAVGCVENGLIVIMLFTRPLLRKRPHVVFVLSLSISDLLSSVIVIMIVTSRFYQEVMYTQSFCLFTYIGSVVCFGMSLVQALVISLERTLAVSTSTLYIRVFQGKRKYLIVIGACAILCLYTIILVASYPISGPVVGCVVALMYDRRSYTGIILGVQSIFIPLVFATLLLYAIAVYRLTKRMHQQVTPMNHERVQQQEATQPEAGASCSTKNTVAPSMDPKSIQPNVGNPHRNHADMYATGINKQTFGEIHIIPLEHLSSRRTGNNPPSSEMTSTTQETNILQQETSNVWRLKSAIKTVSLVQLCLFVSFVPSSVYQVLAVCGLKSTVADIISRTLPILHPVLNPILYVWLIKEFRKEIFCKGAT